MIAFKFLARGAVGPFTGFAWPTPVASTPGAWVEVPPEKLPDRGIHGCLVEHLPYWLDDELWEVELDRLVRGTPTQLIASRGRLLQRVAGWTPKLADEFGEACAIKARDTAAGLLMRNGREKDANQLLACPNVAELQRAAEAMSAASNADFFANIAGYAADAATLANIHHVGSVSYVAAELSRVASSSIEAAISEREWQGRWIAERLQLAEADLRASV